MTDYNALHELYEKCRDIEFSETSDLMDMAESKEEKDFISLVSDFALQQKQKRVIQEKRF